MSKSSAGEVYVRARGETNLDWWEETGQGWKFLYFEGETNGWARFTGWDAPPIGDCWGDLVYVMEANAWRDVGNGNWVAVGSTRLPLVEFRGADEGEKFYSQANKDMVIPFYAQPGYYHYWEMRANVEAKAQCRGIGALLNAEFNSETGIGDFEHLVPRVWLSDQVLP